MGESDEKSTVEDRGGAAAPHMVKFKAAVGISGPGYRVDAGKTGEVPAKYAEIHVKDNHGKIMKAGN